MKSRPTTLGELRKRGYESRSVRDELRANLLRRLADEQPVFAGIVGYDDTVVAAVENAILPARGSASWASAGLHRLNRGRAFVATPEELGEYVLLDYTDRRTRHR